MLPMLSDLATNKFYRLQVFISHLTHLYNWFTKWGISGYLALNPYPSMISTANIVAYNFMLPTICINFLPFEITTHFAHNLCRLEMQQLRFLAPALTPGSMDWSATTKQIEDVKMEAQEKSIQRCWGFSLVSFYEGLGFHQQHSLNNHYV